MHMYVYDISLCYSGHWTSTKEDEMRVDIAQNEKEKTNRKRKKMKCSFI